MRQKKVYQISIWIKTLWILLSFIPFSQLIFPQSNGEVEQDWVAIYSGVGSLRSDEATDIAVDSFGNVYVTGISQGLGYDYDCATIKYDSQGEVQWINRYDGGYDDYAYKLSLDDSGNVYTTGYSESLNTDEDYLTIKYNTNGVEQWVRKYNGPGNLSDRSRDIAVDDTGNVYVTGESSDLGWNRDYATIKYNSLGIEQWVKRYNGPQNSYDEAVGIAVDNFGNIVVTGKSIGINNRYNFATIKYSSKGVELWVQRFTTFGNYSDLPYDITVDSWGNVIVTGTGSSLDTTSFAPDYLTIKYDSTGILLWNSRYNGPGNDFDDARVVAVDCAGNIFITGWSTGEGGSNDYATIKYNPSGTEQWVSRFNGGFVYNLSLDDSGIVYVTGDSTDSTAIVASTTIKYNTYGEQIWLIRYNGPGGFDQSVAIALDESGNVYVTGITYVPGGIPTFDYATIKYKQKIVPVELTNFTASIANNHIILNWETATEMNNSGFEILRGIYPANSGTQNDNNAWEKIGFVPGHGTTTETKQYLFTDNDISSGKYQYKLKQIDYDGSFEYSQIVEVEIPFENIFSLSQNYPNPFNPATKIKFTIPNVETTRRVVFTTMKVFDILGNEVVTLVNEEKPAGSYEVELNGSSLPSGIYFYQLTSENFVETRKMILLK